MRGRAAGIAAPLLLAALVDAGAVEGLVIETRAGVIRGVYEPDGAAVFKGIPYAAAPNGLRRWQPTAPPAPWSGVFDATRFGANCPQPVSSRPVPNRQDEDCLSLSIATPDPGSTKLPVLVFIHGGAFFSGAGSEILGTLPPLVRQGVVLVAPNYRLGRLGFFAHPALRAEAGAGSLANYWLMDQVAALKWVRDNIAYFGGDPGNVTILGCSAGGSSVNSLLASPRASGLFHRAVVRSGGGFFNATRPLDRAEQEGLAFAARVGVTGRDESALRQLRSLTAQQVLAGDPGPPNFGAVVDGMWLPTPISVSFARGEQARVPLMSGSTSDEASVFGLMGFDGAVLAARFGVDLDELRPAYKGDDVLDDAELLRQVQTDFIFTSASIGMAALAARSGVPAYAYHFDHVRAAERASRRGAAHCSDMSFLFTAEAGGDEVDREVSRQLVGYLLNFMRTGDPNGPGLPAWPRSGPSRIEPLVIGEETRAIAGFRSRQLQPWFEKWSTETGLDLDLH